MIVVVHLVKDSLFYCFCNLMTTYQLLDGALILCLPLLDRKDRKRQMTLLQFEVIYNSVLFGKSRQMEQMDIMLHMTSTLAMQRNWCQIYYKYQSRRYNSIKL